MGDAGDASFFAVGCPIDSGVRELMISRASGQLLTHPFTARKIIKY
jgi:hypothetical protein